MQLDGVDLHILEAIQANARITNVELARELEMAPSAILERIRKLEQRQVLLGFEARVAPKSVGLGLTAFIHVKVEERGRAPKAGALLAQIPEVQEVHLVAGEDCYLVKLRAVDTDDLARILREEIVPIASVRSTKTTIVLETVKETATLNLQPLKSKGTDSIR